MSNEHTPMIGIFDPIANDFAMLIPTLKALNPPGPIETNTASISDAFEFVFSRRLIIFGKHSFE